MKKIDIAKALGATKKGIRSAREIEALQCAAECFGEVLRLKEYLEFINDILIDDDNCESIKAFQKLTKEARHLACDALLGETCITGREWDKADRKMANILGLTEADFRERTAPKERV